MNKKLKLNIKPLGILDLLAFKNLVPLRRRKINSGSAVPSQTEPPMNRLAKSLHPKVQHLVVSGIIPEGGGVVSYRLTADKTRGTEGCAFFRAGQYLSITVDIDGESVSRPVSISSSPREALQGFYIISVKQQDDGFVSPHIHNTWKVGTQVEASAPEGDFFYEPLRDARQVLGIAGGCGITPFRSMVRALREGSEDFNLTILYGNRKAEDIIFREELEKAAAESDGKIRLLHVLSDDDPEPGMESGFITKALIEDSCDTGSAYSVFLCGPQAMYDFVGKELAGLGLERKYIRRELFGEARDIFEDPDYPAEAAAREFELKVLINGSTHRLKASSRESLLTAMERGGLKVPSGAAAGNADAAGAVC